MARQRFCKVCRGWHSLDAPWPDECRAPDIAARSGLPSPMLISDTMDPVRSMADGKMYESKSALRAAYREAGVVEVGNDAPADPKPKPPPDRTAVKAAVGRAFSRAGLGA